MYYAVADPTTQTLVAATQNKFDQINCFVLETAIVRTQPCYQKQWPTPIYSTESNSFIQRVKKGSDSISL